MGDLPPATTTAVLEVAADLEVPALELDTDVRTIVDLCDDPALDVDLGHDIGRAVDVDAAVDS